MAVFFRKYKDLKEFGSFLMVFIRLFWSNIHEYFIGKPLQQRYKLGVTSSALIENSSYFIVAFAVESLVIADSYYSAALAVVALAIVTLLSSSLPKILELMTPLSSRYAECARILSFVVLFDYVTADLLDYLWFFGSEIVLSDSLNLCLTKNKKDIDFYQLTRSIYSEKDCKDFKKTFALNNHADKLRYKSTLCKERAAEKFNNGFPMIKKQCKHIATLQNSWPIIFLLQFQIFMNYILAIFFGASK
jgi:hypothetical protein